MWNDLENKIISYADDTTLYAEVASPSECTNVANSLYRDLAKIQSWCSTWGMKLNPQKTHSITISRSRAPNPPHPPLTLCGLDLEVSSSEICTRDFLQIFPLPNNKLEFQKYNKLIIFFSRQNSIRIKQCIKE